MGYLESSLSARGESGKVIQSPPDLVTQGLLSLPIVTNEEDFPIV
jgi:hypothetical protein